MSFNGSSAICLECGLCCNGAIFARGELRSGDDAERLAALGLSLARQNYSLSGNRKFHQPCAAFENGCCRIYSERPEYCRAFECALLKKVNAGELEISAALRIIRSARRRADKVKRLLRKLGDTDEHVALSARVRRTIRRAESNISNDKTAGLFGELTLANHALNILLSEKFYPGSND
ncbi:MAG TPA: YkgJ family cysteine cluster protein [Verrucomicrobiae bacterium]|nr:YkgJ family cysteine cluster protein [Verrucomicrobiae bacterium]